MVRKKNPKCCKICGKKFARISDFIAMADGNGVAYYCMDCYHRNHRMAKGVQKR